MRKCKARRKAKRRAQKVIKKRKLNQQKRKRR